jgi:hypothetical protein
MLLETNKQTNGDEDVPEYKGSPLSLFVSTWKQLS